MNGKAIAMSLTLAIAGAGVGFLAGSSVPPEQGTPGASGGGSAEITRLRQRIAELEKANAALKETWAQRVAKGQTGVAPGEVAAVGSGAVTALEAKVKKLESELALARAGEADAIPVATKIRDLRAEFNAAMAAGEPAKAIKAMGELCKLGEEAFPDVVQLWKVMEDKEWGGLGFMQRRGWANTELFHWALRRDELGIAPEDAKNFQRQGLMFMRWMENDEKKLAATFTDFLSRQTIPEALKEGEGNARGFNRFMSMDPYRMAVMQMSQVNDPGVTKSLGGIASNPDVPADVRIQALRGLADDRTPDSNRAIENALYDSDPEVKKAAELAQMQSQATVPGLFVSSVSDNSVAAQAGIPVGAVVTQLNGQPVNDNRQLWMSYRSNEKDSKITYVYNGATRTVTVKPGGDLGLRGAPTNVK